MSQPMPEAPTRGNVPPRPSGGSGLSRKFGPLPAWGWLLLAAAGGVGYIWYRNHQAASAASTATDTTGTDTSSTDDAASISTLQSEIQQLQGDESSETSSTPASSGGKVKVITVPRAETLSALGKSLKWNTATLKAVEALNGLSASSKLKKGQRIVRPVGKTGEPT